MSGALRPRIGETGGSTTITATEETTQTSEHERSPQTSTVPTPALVLRLESPPRGPRVQWSTDTVDNEHMGKKKSKCCCIYKKKKDWDDSSSSDSDCETGHCRGHVEKHRKPPKDDDGADGGGEGPSSSKT